MAYIIVSHVRLQVTEPRAQNQRVIKNPFLQNTPFTSHALRYASYTYNFYKASLRRLLYSWLQFVPVFVKNSEKKYIVENFCLIHNGTVIFDEL